MYSVYRECIPVHGPDCPDNLTSSPHLTSYLQLLFQHHHYYASPSTSSTSSTYTLSPCPFCSIPALRPSLPQLSRQTRPRKDLPPNPQMAPSPLLPLPNHRHSLHPRLNLLRLLHNPHNPHLHPRPPRRPRLQAQLPPRPAPRPLHHRRARAQCRASLRPPASQWRPVSENRTGDRHAVCDSAAGVPAYVCADVRRCAAE